MAPLVHSPILITEGVRKTVLDNGLGVLTKEDHTSPIVTSMIWYRVGSRNEEPGRTGKSHFLEHMLFKGTARFKKGEIDLITLKNGGTNNAFTAHDFTAYYFSFASDRWEMALEIEADRIVNNLFDPEEFEAEKKVVIEELKTGLDSPWGPLMQELDATAFKLHPYRNPIVGWLQDVERASRGDMREYYRRYYHPNNATLVLVGDFDTEVALEKVIEYFGGIPRGPEAPSVFVHEQAQRGERRFVLRRRSNLPRVAIAYHAPEIAHPDSYALQVLSVILAEGKASRLYQRMVEKEQSVTFVTAEFGEAKDPTLFHIRAECQGDGDLQRIEASIFEELNRLAAGGVTTRELDRAKHQVEAHFVLSKEKTVDQAILLGQAATLYGLDYLETYLDRIASVTAEEVALVCARYLREDNRTLGWLLQDGTESAGGGDIDSSRPALPAASYRRLGDLAFRTTDVRVAAGRSLSVERHVLDNGLKVLLVENPAVPAVSMNVTVAAGSRYEPEEKAGLSGLVGRVLDEGTEHRTSFEIAEAIESVGGAIETEGSYERIVVAEAVLKKDFDLGLELMADLLRCPSFPQEYVEKERERLLAQIRSAKDRPQTVAGWEFSELVYGKHPLHRPAHGYPETVEKITRDDLVDFHRQYFVPNNAIVSVVGDFRIDEVLTKLKHALGRWREGRVVFADFPKPPRPSGVRRKFITMPAEQVNILLGHLGIERANPDYYTLQVLDTILGGGAGFTARIPQKLRDELGLAYSTSASITMTAGLDPGRFFAFIGTSPVNMRRAIDGLLAEIRRIIEEPVTDQELRDAKAYLTGSFVFAFESNAQIARFLSNAELYGLGFDYIEKYPGYINGVTVEELARVAREYLSFENYTLVVVGPIDENGNPLSGT